jgi:hypothetical protein
MEILFTFLSLVLVLTGAYFFTKWYATGQKTRMQASSLQIVDQITLDRDKRLVIIKIQENYYTSILSRAGATQLTPIQYIPQEGSTVHPFQQSVINAWLAKGGQPNETI